MAIKKINQHLLGGDFRLALHLARLQARSLKKAF